MEAQDVIDTLEILAQAGIDATLEGGWGVDALLGAQHRDHGDLDLLIDAGRAHDAIEIMGEVGFIVITDDRPYSVRIADSHGRAIDLVFVIWDASGAAWRGAKHPERVHPDYAPEEFTYGWIAGRRVPCLSPEAQVRRHVGYRLTDRDVADLHALKDRFSVALPEGMY